VALKARIDAIKKGEPIILGWKHLGAFLAALRSNSSASVCFVVRQSFLDQLRNNDCSDDDHRPNGDSGSNFRLPNQYADTNNFFDLIQLGCIGKGNRAGLVNISKSNLVLIKRVKAFLDQHRPFG
jgi:hypothetical protein